MSSNEIALEQDITVSTIDIVRREIESQIERGTESIVIDMSNVVVVDSTGIGYLIKVQNELKEDGKELVFKNVNNDILKMIKIMRLDRHFKIV